MFEGLGDLVPPETLRGVYTGLSSFKHEFPQAREDLLWLAQGRAGWPNPSAAGWAEWNHILLARPAWVKRQILKRLQEDFDKFRAEQLTMLSLWALYRFAQRGRPQAAADAAVWVCTICTRTLKTKAALGAHFFKTHGRCATYRSVAHGTLCGACGRQFWGRTRLACHLRASPGCVDILRAQAPAAAAPAPGLGNRGWRKAREEDFTFSIPEQQQEPLDTVAETRWDATVEEAYKALCDLLLDEQLTEDLATLKGTIVDCLQKFPLYDLEVRNILDVVADEIPQIVEAGLGDYWSEQLQQNLAMILREIQVDDWTAKAAVGARPNSTETLKAFRARVDMIEWVQLLPESIPDETRKVVSMTLGKTWDVAWACASETIGLATVRDGFELRRAS